MKARTIIGLCLLAAPFATALGWLIVANPDGARWATIGFLAITACIGVGAWLVSDSLVVATWAGNVPAPGPPPKDMKP